MKKLFGPLIFLIVLLSNANAHAISIGFAPLTQNVVPGGIATVTLNISGLTGAAPSLGGFDFVVNFNPAILAFTSATFGGNSGVSDQLQLGAACSPASGLCGTTAGAGTVNLFEVSGQSVANLNTLQTDSFILATLRFNALAGGSSSLSFSSVILGDANGDALTTTLGTRAITILTSSVPETSALLLLGVGLIGLSTVLRIQKILCQRLLRERPASFSLAKARKYFRSILRLEHTAGILPPRPRLPTDKSLIRTPRV